MNEDYEKELTREIDDGNVVETFLDVDVTQLVVRQGGLVDNPLATEPTLGVGLPVLQQVGVPHELVVAEDTDGVVPQVVSQSSLGTEAVVAENAEERGERIRGVEQFLVVNQHFCRVKVGVHVRVVHHVAVVVIEQHWRWRFSLLPTD